MELANAHGFSTAPATQPHATPIAGHHGSEEGARQRGRNYWSWGKKRWSELGKELPEMGKKRWSELGKETAEPDLKRRGRRPHTEELRMERVAMTRNRASGLACKLQRFDQWIRAALGSGVAGGIRVGRATRPGKGGITWRLARRRPAALGLGQRGRYQGRESGDGDVGVPNSTQYRGARLHIGGAQF